VVTSKVPNLVSRVRTPAAVWTTVPNSVRTPAAVWTTVPNSVRTPGGRMFFNCSRIRSPVAIIAFLGIGTMGSGMVKNLAKHNHTVFAWNRTKIRAEAMESEHIRSVTLSQVVGAEYLITCLANDSALDTVLFHSGLLEALSPGKMLIDCGTTSVAMTQRIAKACKERGVMFLDAPITGSKVGAENGTLMFMVGGEQEVFEKALPILKTLGTKHVYCGQATLGQKAKIALNLTQALVLESYLEGLALGVKNGVPLATMREILDNSGAKNAVSLVKVPQILQGDFAQRFKLGLMYKDLLLARKEMERLKIILPLADRISYIYEDAMEFKDEDIAATAKMIERKAGVKFQ
jgi:3-hydroxyisobutyrate dehydrogenase-like beta-hydroxyacid dehydrogenase